MNGNGMPTPHSYGTPHTTTKLVGNTFFGPDFNLEKFRGMSILEKVFNLLEVCNLIMKLHVYFLFSTILITFS